MKFRCCLHRRVYLIMTHSICETKHICILLLVNPMQENFSKAQRFNNAHVMALRGYSLPGQPSSMRNLCKKFAKGEMCKKKPCCGNFPCEPKHYHDDGYYASNQYVKANGPVSTNGAPRGHDRQTGKNVHEAFDGYCTPNEGCAACDVHPHIDGTVINFSSGRQWNFPASIRKVAGGGIEHFEGRIDDTKYGNYGTSMNQAVETFCPGATNARMMGAALDMSWTSGVMDAKCKAHIQPFQPQRYQQYYA